MAGRIQAGGFGTSDQPLMDQYGLPRKADDNTFTDWSLQMGSFHSSFNFRAFLGSYLNQAKLINSKSGYYARLQRVVGK